MKFKVWLEKERQMSTTGISLNPDGKLSLAVYDPQKRASKEYGYFLQQLPMLATPWSSSEMHNLDEINIYVGDVVSDDTGGSPYVVVPAQYGTIRFIYADTMEGTFVIGCPWDNISDNVIVHGNVFEHSDLVHNKALLEAAFKYLQLCKLEIK